MSALLPGVRKKTTVVALDLRMSFREIDPGVLAPRVAAAVFLFAGVFAMIVDLFVPQFHAEGTIVPIAIALDGVRVRRLLLAVAAVQPASPARVARVRVRAVRAGAACSCTARAGRTWRCLPLPFVFVGFTQPPGTATLISPFAAIALVVAGRFDFDASVYRDVAVRPADVGRRRRGPRVRAGATEPGRGPGRATARRGAGAGSCRRRAVRRAPHRPR